MIGSSKLAAWDYSPLPALRHDTPIFHLDHLPFDSDLSTDPQPDAARHHWRCVRLPLFAELLALHDASGAASWPAAWRAFGNLANFAL